MDIKFRVSSSPHINSNQYINTIMRDVLIALFPALFVGVWVFGLRALTVTLTSILSCVAFEILWNKVCKKEETIGDLSACVTGVLLAFSMPVSVPLWIPVIGAFFAIIICKQLFGGLGQNFINPALGARAFLLASWPVIMTAFTKPFSKLPILSSVNGLDALTGATPLAAMKLSSETTPYMNLFLGNIGGSIGEVSAIALLIGGAYLVIRKVITLHAPIAYFASIGIFSYIMGYSGAFSGDALFSILSGGVMIGGLFMLTDYTTSPSTKLGSVIAGLIAGFVTVLIRVKGGYPEGVTYAILIVNILTPLIDKYIRPRKYGRVRNNG